MELIDKGELYKRTAEWEEQAQAEVLKNKGCRTVEEWDEYRKWLIILNERSSFKYDVADAPTIEAEPRWIPATERLPETHKEDSIFEDDYKCSDAVIASLAEPFEGNVVVIATYDEGHDEELRYGWTDAFEGEELKVVAWMPLPEPYKEGEDGKN